MSFTVADLLALPVMQRARPQVVTGGGLEQRDVRWVHTSEIYEIAPLLKGGEVLLTTGLGLVAVGSEARREYVRAIAGVGASALFMELGRTFLHIPQDIADEARSVGIPFIVLHGVVPFIEVTEVVHARLLAADHERLVAASQARHDLVALLADTRDVVGFVGGIAALAECDVSLRAGSGELVAGTEPAGEPTDADRVAVPILVNGQEWGILTVFRSPDEFTETLVDEAVPLVAMELRRMGARPLSRYQAGSELIRDMLSGRYGGAAEISSRAIGAGFTLAAGFVAVGLCVSTPKTVRPTSLPSILAAARTVATKTIGLSLAGEFGGNVYVAARVNVRDIRKSVSLFAADLNEELRATLGVSVLVGVGTSVADVPGLVGSLRSAGDTVQLAARLAPSSRVVFADDFALYQLLASLVDDEALERFVAGQLGPLLDYDARTGSGLVMTLDTYFACGLSKVATADVLGIQRQTMYGRLERISKLLGGLDLSSRERRTALDLALVSWRMRLAAASAS